MLNMCPSNLPFETIWVRVTCIYEGWCKGAICGCTGAACNCYRWVDVPSVLCIVMDTVQPLAHA